MENITSEASWSLKSIQVGTFITSVVLLAGSVFFKSAPLTLGIFTGAVLAFINFTLLHKIMIMMTAGKSTKALVPGLLVVFKFFLVAAAVFVLLYYKQVDPIGLIVGLSSIVITLTLMALVNQCYGDLLNRK
jgi:hypothetical protein